MNVYLHELKSHRKGLFFWSLAMVFLVASGIAKYHTYQTAGQSISAILNQFPRTVQIIFGINGFNLSRISGYYGILFLYIALTATIQAVLLGSDIIAKEERDRTSEFLYVRPITRQRVITAKLLAGLTCLVVLNIETYLASLYFVSLFAKGQTITSYISWLMVALFMLQLTFFSLGTVIAGISKKPKMSASLSSAILMITLLLMYFVNFNQQLSFFKYLTPFKYFEAQTILVNNHLEPIYVVLSALIVVVATYATYYFYDRRDLAA